MHLGNGAITPECAAVTYGAAAAGLAASAVALRAARPNVEKLWLAVSLGCAVFAAQAINVPVASGISGHLVGGVLLAWALGPALGAWTMAAVLVAQALLMGDGGMAALGANVINMALVPAGIFAVVKQATQSVGSCIPTQSVGTRKEVKVGTAHATTLGFAAGLAVLLAAGLIVAETAMFRPADELTAWSAFAARMVVYHLWIGTLEGLATAGIFASVAAAAHQKIGVPRLAIGLAAAVVVAALALPISSSLPDGYEAAAERSGVEWLLER
jgi:cobalt/nickel transport system permease protein